MKRTRPSENERFLHITRTSNNQELFALVSCSCLQFTAVVNICASVKLVHDPNRLTGILVCTCYVTTYKRTSRLKSVQSKGHMQASTTAYSSEELNNMLANFTSNVILQLATST
jgi:hypothetical protein